MFRLLPPSDAFYGAGLLFGNMLNQDRLQRPRSLGSTMPSARNDSRPVEEAPTIDLREFPAYDQALPEDLFPGFDPALMDWGMSNEEFLSLFNIVTSGT